VRVSKKLRGDDLLVLSELNSSMSGKAYAGAGGVAALQGIVATPGDTDLNDVIDGADYARVDTTFNNETSTQTDIGGWFNGDFDDNGRVDGADYALIDSYFNQQGAPSGAAIPEPVSAVIVGFGAVLLSRVRR
jgi:hypothetical protein